MNDPQLSSPLAKRANEKRIKSFVGQRVLVTGGSSGIGLELGRALAREGASVCIAARGADGLERALRELRTVAGPDAQPPCSVVMDVSSPDSIAAGLQAALKALGGLDILINNAGYAQVGYIDELDDQAYVDMMAVNYFGPMRLVRACLPHFIAQGGGRIVNVTSMFGFMGTFGYSAYCASKFAISGFTEVLRQDVMPFGVHVHLCYPPTTLTPGLERENKDKPPEAWAIEGGHSKAFGAQEVARAILNGVRRGKFQILVGWDSWFIWAVQRFAPWLVRRVTDRTLLKALRPRQPGRALRPPQHS